MDPLPQFRYYPDPLSTGVIVPSENPCLGCNRIRGYIYTGPVNTEKNFILTEAICPWCIADGTIAKRFEAFFNDTGSVEGLADAVREEIEKRTPGFEAWQQEEWMGHCGDGAAFLGLVGKKELERDFPKAIPVVKKCLREQYDLDKEEADEMFDGLTKDSEPSAYLFRCLHCQKFLAYADEA